MKAFKKILLFFLFGFISILSYSQSEYQKTSFKINKKATVYPDKIQPDFNPTIINLEAPSPDGNSAKSYLLRQKIASKEYYSTRKKQKSIGKSFEKSSIGPEIGFNFEPTRYTSNGTAYPIYGGIPSDNALAVSNAGAILVGMNSTLYAHDISKDTALFPNFQISLKNFVQGSNTSSYYDPKLTYDPIADRFILALLKDYAPSNSAVIMCFSTTNNPNDPWNIYHLPGNPLNNNRWTDFPCLAVTESKIYFTANLIVPNVSWQVGFDGSIIWEMDKQAVYTGAADINSVLYSDIKYGGTFTRNLIPVPGANGIADELFLLSNRNFAIENDTVFFMKLTNGTLQINALKSDLPYGVPPNARQFDTDLTDPTSGLQTNDARILGAIKFEDEIQYVGNTINPTTGFSAIYHGIISDLNGSPTIHGTIIGDTIKDFGYPNLASSGNEICDREVIIGFDFTSPTHFPGVAAIHVDNDRSYSPIKIVKNGYNYVNRLSTGYERWGDYFGMQAKYNQPGTTYAFGYLALIDKKNSGFCVELKSPDTLKMSVNFEVQYPITTCNNTLNANIENGELPYHYYWNDSLIEGTNSLDSLCSEDSVKVQIFDARGCSITAFFKIPAVTTTNFSSLPDGVNVFPNPSSDKVSTQFTLEKTEIITIKLYDQNGKFITVLLEKEAQKGLNEFSFDIDQLAHGYYTIVVLASNEMIHQFKVIKS